MFKSLDKIGRDISKAVDQVGRDISKKVDENWKSPLLFKMPVGVVDKAGNMFDSAVKTLDKTCNEIFFGESQLKAGLFDAIKSTASNTASKLYQNVKQEVNKSLTGSTLTNAMSDNLRTGNVVQLVSRSSGKSLQIVTSPTGQLVVDGLGPIGNEFYHAHWTVLNEGKNTVRLHNQNNYLAIYNGATVIAQFPDPSVTSPETRFRMHQIANFICLESVVTHKQHVGVMKDGTLKAAVATGTEMDGQFGVQVVYSPYGAPPAPAKK